MSLKYSGWVLAKFFVHFLAMYLQCTGSGHHPLPPVISNLSVSVFRSISVQHLDGEIDGDLLEVVFFNEQGVNVASTGTRVKESNDRELLVVVRGETFNFNFRERM